MGSCHHLMASEYGGLGAFRLCFQLQDATNHLCQPGKMGGGRANAVQSVVGCQGEVETNPLNHDLFSQVATPAFCNCPSPEMGQGSKIG